MRVRLVAAADLPRVASVLSAENPDHPTTTRDLAGREVAAHLLAEVNGAVVGTAFAGPDPMSHREGKLKIDVRVRPESQGRGVGRALYDALLAELAALHPDELHADVRAASDRGVRFARSRGFIPAWRRLDLALDVSGQDHDEEPWEPDTIGAVALSTLRPGEERELHELHDLISALWADVPYPEPVGAWTFEQFRDEVLADPGFRPGGCVLARRGGELVGCSVTLLRPGFLHVDFTGVRRDARRLGIAEALKKRSHRHAREFGLREVRTTNDEGNAAMLALNRKLGFRELGATVRFVRSFR